MWPEAFYAEMMIDWLEQAEWDWAAAEAEANQE